MLCTPLFVNYYFETFGIIQPAQVWFHLFFFFDLDKGIIFSLFDFLFALNRTPLKLACP